MNNSKHEEPDFELLEEVIHAVESREPIIIGITHGDLNGISYEVILKSLHDKDIVNILVPVIYGSPKVAVYFQRRLALEDFNFYSTPTSSQINKNRINIINVYDQEIKIESGESSVLAGELAVKALEQAVMDVKEGVIQAIVTGPINKENVQGSNFNFSGHTEFFANRFGVKNEDTLMFMIHENTRIGLATNHLPINQVASAINQELLVHKINIMNQSLKRDFGIVKPKIAVLALNPHAGDNGFLGDEEKKIIEPAIKDCLKQGILTYGPYAADGFFGSGKQNHFDGILSMYHDQGLIAFKTLAGGEGVNFTAGLPIVRTSPSHGTAYEIVGKNEASPSSMIEALFLACDIYRNRQTYDEMYKDPLKIGIAQEVIGTTKFDENIDPFAEN